MIAKYKGPLGLWLFFWCFLLVTAVIYWEGDSPLLWPDVWGVIEWLASSAVFAALWAAVGLELDRQSRNGNRLQDILASLSSLARDFALVALMFAIGALRIALYRGEARADLAWFYGFGPEPFIFHSPFIICFFASISAIGAFSARIIAALFRTYGEQDDPITPR